MASSSVRLATDTMSDPLNGTLAASELSAVFKKDVEGIMFNKQDPFVVLRVDPRGDGAIKDPAKPLPKSNDVQWSSCKSGGGKKPSWPGEVLNVAVIDVRVHCCSLGQSTART